MPEPEWTTACPDWERRIVDGRSLIPFAPLFPNEAEVALAYFRALRIVDAAGRPPIGDSSRPWLIDLAAAIFGAYDPQTGRRLIREFLLLISKKNGKSTTAAGIMLTALLLNWRESAEYYILAPTLKVANNSFFAARDMVRADDELTEILHVQEHIKTITHRASKALLRVVAADAETVSGQKTTGILIDELWLFGKRANAANMLSEATGGLVSRPEGFVIMLSTQSDEPPAGVFKEKLSYFRKVRDGEIVNKRSLPVIYEFPHALVKSKAYLKPENFYVTNPNLGLSVDPQWLVEKLREAQDAEDPAGGVNLFLAKHLNVEIGQNLRADRWAGADSWQAAADPTLTLATLLARCEVVVAGIDGGGLDDLLSVTFVGRERVTRRWLAWGRSFVHIKGVLRRKASAAQLIDFAKAGDLVVVDNDGPIEWHLLAAIVESEDGRELGPGRIAIGDAVSLFAPSNEDGKSDTPEPDADSVPPDIALLVELCVEVDHAGLLHGVGIDPAGVGMIVDALAAAGIYPETEGQLTRVHAVSQGYKLMGAIKTAERKLDDGTFVHAGQPIYAWAVGNAKTELKGNALMITKQLSGAGKIDPLMSLFDAVALMSLNPELDRSIYTADRGLAVFG
jgi:phage terminase large subunit-like protein